MTEAFADLAGLSSFHGGSRWKVERDRYAHPLDRVGDPDRVELPLELVRWLVFQHGDDNSASLRRIPPSKAAPGFLGSVPPLDYLNVGRHCALHEATAP
ncbi:hypothetical protein AB0O70_00155 [Microbacterium paraoxydans]|jgi:hypothetical protein|uniref:hypothetical protein n=1 Tax=Microbacterium TaxID=33882 RepID=UPI00131A428A|nr:hypothetical protein [Microbacterium sp. str. 'China']